MTMEAIKLRDYSEHELILMTDDELRGLYKLASESEDKEIRKALLTAISSIFTDRCKGEMGKAFQYNSH